MKRENRELLRRLQMKVDELEKLAVKDPLTQLCNHVYLQEQLGREIARSERTDAPFGLLVLHLDGLGRIDLTGAQVLRELMEQLLEGGLDVEMSGVPPHAVRILDAVNKASPF